MKTLRYYLVIVSCCILIGCSKSDISNEKVQQSVATNIEHVISLAEKSREAEVFTKSDFKMKVDRSHIYYITNDVLTKSSSRDTLMYILNFERNEGFAVFSASEHPQLICVTQKGFYDGKPTGIFGFDEYMRQMISECSHIDDESIAEEDVSTKGSYPVKIVVKPFIPVSWHQNYPFNWYCSSPYNEKVPAGCVAIAIAQAMSVYGKPENINLTYDGAPSSTEMLNWEDMISHSSISCAYGACSICNMKAYLLREIGKRVDMKYAEKGSGAKTLLYAKSCLQSFGFQCDDYQDFNVNTMTKSLDLKRPIIIRAQTKDGASGHAWNIDGYQYQEETRYQYSSSGQTTGQRTREYWYFYFKYGGGGINDGLYLSYQKDTATGSFTATGKEVVSTPVTIFDDRNGLNCEVKVFTNIRVD